MFTVRPYNKKDFPAISRWWSEAQEIGPTEAMMPEESSFIVESEFNELIAAVTVYMTNTTQFAMVDNLVGNPTFHGKYRKDAISFLQSYIEKWCVDHKYRGILCMAYRPSLVKRYEELGYIQTLSEVTTMLKPLTGVN